MTYFVLPNLSSNNVTTEPDLQKVAAKANKAMPPGFGNFDKPAKAKFLNSPATTSAMFSTFEAVNPNLRVSPSAENPVWKMHGFVVDYDAAVGFQDKQSALIHFTKVLKSCNTLLPTWYCITPSGRGRLVWEFQEPLGLSGVPKGFLIELLHGFVKTLKAKSLLAGLDEAALLNPSIHYHGAGTWIRINPTRLLTVDVQGIFVATATKASKFNRNHTGLVEIPMDKVFEQIEKKYPGRWPQGTKFEEGARGPAVWDPTSSDPTSTIYHRHGAYRFSGEGGLVPYEKILGKGFVRQYEENKIGKAIEDIYYAGREGYFRKFPTGVWRRQTLREISHFLFAERGLSPKRPSQETPSEVDHALNTILQYRAVDGGIPLVYDPREVVRIGNFTFVNTARTQVMAPAKKKTPKHWGDGFPWIASWLWDMYSPRKQLVYFLAWLKLFYEGAYRGDLRRGQALFIVGGVNRGKTLLNAYWIPRIMGGGADAGDFLVEGKGFNKELMEYGHWHIDDSLAAADQRSHNKFTERVKRLIANPFVVYHPKFVDAQTIPFRGRLGVTLNEDADSLRMIPDLAQSIEDKLMVLRGRGADKPSTFRFGSSTETERRLNEETPAFLAWLLKWEPPAFIMGGRFGMRSYIEPTTQKEATDAGFDSDLLGLLDILRKSDEEFMELTKTGKPWVGTAAGLTTILVTNPVTSRASAGLSVRSIGIRLGKLARLNGTGINMEPNQKKGPNGSTIYVIHN